MTSWEVHSDLIRTTCHICNLCSQTARLKRWKMSIENHWFTGQGNSSLCPWQAEHPTPAYALLLVHFLWTANDRSRVVSRQTSSMHASSCKLITHADSVGWTWQRATSDARHCHLACKEPKYVQPRQYYIPETATFAKHKRKKRKRKGHQSPSCCTAKDLFWTLAHVCIYT
jgi:hypothetical protein